MIQFNEFETIYRMIPDLSHIFSLIDTNNDMAIDKDEINMFAYTHLGNVDLNPYIEYFNQADQHGDGYIQFNEFEAFIQNLHIF
jgi:Ca2+-binding EF-hand superfamily protein